MKVADLLRESIALLEEKGIENPVLDAEVLMAHGCDTERFQIILKGERELSAEEEKTIRNAVERRGNFEPVAYIVGFKEFYSLDFLVNPAVLIPRPETELLVDMAIYHIPQSGTFLDIGTGSGNIAASVKYSRRDAKVYASDISPDALGVARKNIEALLPDEEIVLCEGSLFEPWEDMTFDVIASNPPYIDPDTADLPPDLKYEPEGALFAPDRKSVV